MYGEALNISRKYFRCLVQEYYKQYNINLTDEDGISPKCLNSICEKYDIAHYAFDAKKNCLLNIFQKIEIIKRWFILLLIIICILYWIMQLETH